MKRYIVTIILSCAIIASCITTAFAGFGGGTRGGGWASTGFGSNTTPTLVSYEVLSQLCVDVNYGIVNGDFNSVMPFSQGGNTLAASLYTNSTYSPYEYYIVVMYNGTRYYYTNQSGGRYYAVRDVDNNALLGTISSYLSTITTYVEKMSNAIGTSTSGLLKNISDRSLTIANRLQYSVSGTTYTAAQSLYNIWAQLGSSGTLAGKADSIINALGPNGSIVGALGVMQNNLTVSLSPGTKINTVLEQDSTWITPYVSYTDGTEYPVLHVNEVVANNLVSYINNYMMGLDAKYLSRDTDYTVVNVSRKVTHAYINNSNEIRVRVVYPDGTYNNYYLCTPQHNLIKVASSYVSTSSIYTAITNLETAINNISGHDYSTVLNDIKGAVKPGEIWVNNNQSLLNSMPTVTISYESAQDIIAYLNDQLVGKNINFLATNGDAYQVGYTTTYSHAYIDNSTNRIRIVGINSSGNASTFTMVTPNRSVYVVARNNILDAVNRIYDWLDNADLATNQTIINIINDDEDVAQDSITIMSRIRSLFKSVYDFNGGIIQTIADFAGSATYFNGLGVD